MIEETSFLQDKITSETCGILWLTKNSLKEKPKPFFALNYFFDGLLMNFYQREVPSQKLPNLFFTRNFNKNLFLGHYNIDSSNIDEEVSTFLGIVENLAEKNSQILILHPKKACDQLIKKVTKREFFDFQTFNLS